MIEKNNPFYDSVVRLQQELQLKRINFDIEESRYGHFFSLKVYKCNDLVNTFIAMPFEHEMHLSEKDTEKYYILDVGQISDEYVRILNDIYLGDTTQLIKVNPETKEIYNISVKVECLTEFSSYNEEKNMWYVPTGTTEINFLLTPVKNLISEFDVTGFDSFYVKSMEKRTNNMTFNGVEGESKLNLHTGPQKITVNIVQDDTEQVFRIKLKDKDCASQWITHYVAFKTKDL